MDPADGNDGTGHPARGISAANDPRVDDLGRPVEAERSRLSRWIGRRGAARVALARARIEFALGERHLAGRTLEDAVAGATAEARSGCSSTFGYWPHPGETAPVVASIYLRTVDAIAEAGLDASVSVKLDRLDFDRDAFRRLVQEAVLRGVRLHVDAQDHRWTDATLGFVEEATALGADVGATLPSRWVRSFRDAERLGGIGIPCRIVKGQARDPDHPDIDPRRSFVDLVRHVAGRASHVAVATHDARVAEPALDALIAARTPCSLEQLQFLPRLDAVAARRGVPVRVYVAYGRPGLPYTLTQVARRPAILGWAVRDLLARVRAPANGGGGDEPVRK